MKNKTLEVYYHNKHVGTLAQTPEKMIAFQYDNEWIKEGFPINPLTLRLDNTVFIPEAKSIDIFHGLHGVFADSLPDSWGELLLDRYLESIGIASEDLSILDRLSYVGKSGMGALEYRPSKQSDYDFSINNLDYDIIAKSCNDLLSSKQIDELNLLYNLGGSSGGTRPKIYLHEDNRDWILKFPANNDPAISGIREYDYSLCAKRCGINMTETKLVPSKFCEGYFMTERFDKKGNDKVFSITFAGLLDIDFRAPSCDYETFMKVVQVLTKDNIEDKKQMYKIMCFNVLTHNRDDHTKNFSMLFTKDNGFRLAPAYDLTYSTTYYGEHTTSVNGKGKDITDKDLITVGTKAGLSKKFCTEDLELIKSETTSLAKYLKKTSSVKKHISWSDRLKEIAGSEENSQGQ